jgi:hypothetical protein
VHSAGQRLVAALAVQRAARQAVLQRRVPVVREAPSRRKMTSTLRGER